MLARGDNVGRLRHQDVRLPGVRPLAVLRGGIDCGE
jgi:hypothetical protein